MSYLGSWKIDDVLTFPAITHRFDTGALTDADAVPAYRVYEDETSTAILTGNMAKLDDTNTTGFYSEAITLSAANGFEKGKCYTVYITAAVNSVTGGSFHTFQIEAEVDANVVSDKTGYSLANGAITAAVIATDAIDADAMADGAITAATFAAGAITATVIATDAIDADAIADGAITSGVFASGAITADAIAADAIGSSELAATAITEIQSGLSTLDAAGIRTAVGLASANLDTQLSAIDDFLDTEVAAIKTQTDKLTFTVANQVDANIQYVNDVQVTGTGAVGDEWGP